MATAHKLEHGGAQRRRAWRDTGPGRSLVGRRNNDRGWTVFHLPSTPWVLRGHLIGIVRPRFEEVIDHSQLSGPREPVVGSKEGAGGYLESSSAGVAGCSRELNASSPTFITSTESAPFPCRRPRRTSMPGEAAAIGAGVYLLAASSTPDFEDQGASNEARGRRRGRHELEVLLIADGVVDGCAYEASSCPGAPTTS